MFRLLIVFSCLLFLSNSAFANCLNNNAVLGANYLVSITGPNGKTIITRKMVLWRNGNQVAHEYLDNRITELWEQTSNGMLRLVRLFDDHQRGIEYQPNEINNGRGFRDWEQKYQLVSNHLIASMQLETTKGKGCDKIETYSLKKKGDFIALEWLANQGLVKSYKKHSSSGTTKWELKSTVTDSKQIKAVFNTKASYQTTDYADIGDNESDPFLQQMINLGFIAHGASGFYDSEGHQLGGRHDHQH